MAVRFNIFVLTAFLLQTTGLYAQGQTIYSRNFVKSGKIVFRLLAKDKKAFDELNAKSLDVVRYENINGTLSNPYVVKNLLRSYYEGDSSAWLKLFRKDKDKAGFVYSWLYPRKSNEKLSAAESDRLERMAFQLMMLSCDLDHEVAQACGLYAADSTVDNSKIYSYVFSMHTQSTSPITHSVLAVTIDASHLSANRPISDLKGKTKRGICTLNWKAISYKSEYGGYNVYRSADSISFKKINKTPLILANSQFEKNKQFIYYSDSLPADNKKYYYFVKGINFFGEEGAASNTFITYSAATIKSTPVIDTLKVAGNGSVRLSWRMTEASETKLVAKYIVLRSDRENGTYSKLFESAQQLAFTDKNVHATCFYKIAAVTGHAQDTIESFSRMVVVIDTVPPATVANGNARVDKNGKLILTWNKNKEGDLLGYKIFRANQPTDEFVQVNAQYIKDTFYVEKLNLKTLSKKLYFKLAADDKNRNSSPLSEVIEVTRPDTIAPSSPILSSVLQKNNGLEIRFRLSASDDIVKHTLWRKDSVNGKFSDRISILKNDTVAVFIDTLVVQGNTYTYKIQAVDESGNKSFSNSIEQLYETGFRKRVEDIWYAVDRSRKQILLSWNYNEKGIEKYVLYRGKKNEKLTVIKTLDAANLQYIDNTVSMGNLYEYRLKAVMENGAESIISAPINIQY